MLGTGLPHEETGNKLDQVATGLAYGGRSGPTSCYSGACRAWRDAAQNTASDGAGGHARAEPVRLLAICRLVCRRREENLEARGLLDRDSGGLMCGGAQRSVRPSCTLSPRSARCSLIAYA